MPEFADILLFIPASILLILVPGPDILFLLTQSITHGRVAGVATATGLSLGNLVHTTAAALGISVIFQTSAWAFQGLKIAGVIYLLFLAWKALTSKTESTSDDAQPSIRGRSLFARGLLMNILNPKVAIFFLAFLPQFVNPQAGAVGWQIIIYGVLFTLLTLLIFGAIGLFAGHLGKWLRSAKTGHYLNRIAAGVFVALAVRLAFVEPS